jgi:tetratricopeptide (TPR) repeat protein
LLGLRPFNATRSGSISDYKLSSLDKKLRNKRFIRDNFRGANPGNTNLFQGPVSSDTEKFSRRLDRLAARKKKIDDEFLSKSRVYTNQDRTLSRGTKFDVNLVQETSREKVFKNDLLAESLVLPGSEQIGKPLTPDAIRQKLSEMLALEELQEKQTDKPVELFDNMKNKDDAGKSEESKQDAGMKDSDKGKGGKDIESDAPSDPLAGVTPGNIDYKLQVSSQVITKIKDFQALVDNKFTKYMTTADKCIVEGEYHKAMSTYDIASAWKSDDPRPYAGKAFAHLAVGEYFDSSRCLIRAIESSGDFAAGRTDIAATIGNKKLYDKRFTNLKSIFEVDGDYRKAFLLAYLYTQEGDFAKAKECVDHAAIKMAKTAAWKSLSKVIEERLAITK